MAKKKADKPDMPATTPAPVEPKIKPVRLDLDEQEHRQLRAVAGLNGLSMTGYAYDVVMRAVREELKERGIDL